MAERDQEPLLFTYAEGDALFCYPFLRRAIPDTDWFDVESAYGYGGPIASSVRPDFLEHAWSAFNEWCGSNRIVAEFIPPSTPIWAMQSWRVATGM